VRMVLACTDAAARAQRIREAMEATEPLVSARPARRTAGPAEGLLRDIDAVTRISARLRARLPPRHRTTSCLEERLFFGVLDDPAPTRSRVVTFNTPQRGQRPWLPGGCGRPWIPAQYRPAPRRDRHGISYRLRTDRSRMLQIATGQRYRQYFGAVAEDELAQWTEARLQKIGPESESER